MADFRNAEDLLHKFKGEAYLHGLGILPRVGPAVARLGRRAVLVRDLYPGAEQPVAQIRESLAAAGVSLVGELDGARANAPREDLERITAGLRALNPEVSISFGGGSTIDAVKAAEVLRTLGGSVEDYFGTGLVSKAQAAAGKSLGPHVAIQSAASSGAHLTKYSNITDVRAGQKKLIVDEAIVPVQPVFDYAVTLGAPAGLTADGALDGLAHALEVLYGSVGKGQYELVAAVAEQVIGLVVTYLPRALAQPRDPEVREALGRATDLGAYAIMLGGTNGAHLTSFSLVDILTHGRACAIMNPYYTVFFAPAVEGPLKLVARILNKAGYAPPETEGLSGRALGLAVARALMAFEASIGYPTCLADVPGFGDEHIERALAAAKDPQLKSKLENMPVPLTADRVDEYMGPILQAAKTGELEMIRNI